MPNGTWLQLTLGFPRLYFSFVFTINLFSGTLLQLEIVSNVEKERL